MCVCVCVCVCVRVRVCVCVCNLVWAYESVGFQSQLRASHVSGHIEVL